MHRGAKSRQRRRQRVGADRRSCPGQGARASDSVRQPPAGTPAERSQTYTPQALPRAVWEREMRRLQVGVRVLAAVLLALATRIIVDGLEPVSAATSGVIAVLLVATIGLRREGRRLEPPPSEQRKRDYP